MTTTAGSDRVTIKYVKKARMWCKTTWGVDAKGKQTQSQEWFMEDPRGGK